jgi:hypothetical protein
MLNKEPSPQRAKLGFKDAVLSSFKFLIELGLHPVDEKITFVRYESSEVYVNVYHGRASFELGVEIGRLKEPEKEKLGIYDIVAWAGAEKAEGFGQHVMFQVSSRQGVQEFVPKLACLVQKYAIPFIKGDATAYREALEVRSRAAAEYVKQVNLRQTRSKAEAAWHEKDYSQVVELFRPVREHLSEVEAKKLAYAEQQVLTAEGVGSRSFSRKRH